MKNRKIKFPKFLAAVFLFAGVFLKGVAAQKVLSRSQCLEDLEQLKNHLADDCLSYEKIVRQGLFDFEAGFQKIHNEIVDFASPEITDEDLLLLFDKNLQGLPDHHISVRTEETICPLFQHEIFFDSGLVLEETDVPGTFTVIENPRRILDMESGDTMRDFFGVSMVPKFSDGKKRLTVGCYVRDSLADVPAYAIVRLNGIPVNFYTPDITSAREYKNILRAGQLFMRIPNFNNENDDALLEFSDFGSIAKNKDLVIIDLTGNYGGYISYVLRFLCNFFDKKYDGDMDFKLFAEILLNREIGFNAFPGGFPAEDGDKFYAMLKDAAEKNIRTQKKISGDSRVLKGWKSQFNGKIVFIVDKYSLSSSEIMILLFRKNLKNVCVIGENTGGVWCYLNPLEYELKNSKIVVTLPHVQSVFAKDNPFEMDSDYGIEPDYWCVSKDDVLRTLEELGAKEKLLKEIREFYAKE